jgi:hypothetical protein
MRVAVQTTLYSNLPPAFSAARVTAARASDALPAHYPYGVSRFGALPAERVVEGELLRPAETKRPAANYVTLAPAIEAAAIPANLQHPAIAAYITNSLRPDLIARRTGRLVDDYA